MPYFSSEQFPSEAKASEKAQHLIEERIARVALMVRDLGRAITPNINGERLEQGKYLSEQKKMAQHFKSNKILEIRFYKLKTYLMRWEKKPPIYNHIRQYHFTKFIGQAADDKELLFQNRM